MAIIFWEEEEDEEKHNGNEFTTQHVKLHQVPWRTTQQGREMEKGRDGGLAI